MNLLQLVSAAKNDPDSLRKVVRDAGIAGSLSYALVELTFFAVALPIGYFAWHSNTGEWLQPMLLLQPDGVEGKARLLGLLLSYIVLLKAFFPVRLGSTLLLTPYAQRLLGEGIPMFRDKRQSLKKELEKLAEKSRGGILSFDTEDQKVFDSTISQLEALNPTPCPAQSPLFSGQWECLWTTEREINFAAEKGFFGLPWERTYQNIDIPEGSLENVLQFENGSLRVGSKISPDEDNVSRFNFEFQNCLIQWRSVQLQVPPVGKGWGELLYLDEDIRIQRDVRGDLLIATRVR